jgi:hypothetical protein
VRLSASAPTVDLFAREGCLGLLSAKPNKGSSQCRASRTIARAIMPVVRVGRPQERLAASHSAVSGSTRPGELERQTTNSVRAATRKPAQALSVRGMV